MGGRGSGNLPDLWPEAAAAPENALAGRENGEGERGATSGLAPPPRGGAVFGHTSAGSAAAVLRPRAAPAVSPGGIGPRVRLVGAGDLLIVMDGPLRGGRRGALGTVPELQVAQDPLDHRAVADQTDDFKRSAAAGTNQGIGFVYLLNQPGPRASAAARELLDAIGIVISRRLGAGRLGGCESGRLSRDPARVREGAVIADQRP